MTNQNNKCPCHSQKPYEECCKPYHDGFPAENALVLMRSRYSAYALQLTDYIIQTTYNEHIKNDPEIRKGIQEFSRNTEFEGLQILDCTENGDIATVTFRATLKQHHRDVSFTEKSLFIKIDNRWFYCEPSEIHS
jgi:SEC-C motif-containing protein